MVLQYNVTDFGAVGNGIQPDTIAIQQAIDSCSETGGEVIFPKGVFLTGTLFLKSNVRLLISSSAVIMGSPDISLYPGTHANCVEAPSFGKVLFFAENAEKIEICGKGTIDGQGSLFNGERPMMFRFVDCKNIFFSDLVLRSSASWCCHMISCDSIHITRVTLENKANYNNDGFDLDGCSNVFITSTKINSTDDSICLKSTTEKICTNIIIDGCILSSETAGIKFGTSSKSGFRNVTITNTIFHDCDMGTIKLLCVDGGVLENVIISNIIMNRVGSPLFIRLGNRGLQYMTPAEMDFWGEGKVATVPPGIIRNIQISNLIADVTVVDRSRNTIFITGIPGQKVENISLSNVEFYYPGDGTNDEKDRTINEDVPKYPEQHFFGPLPSYGIFARHVHNLRFNNINIYLQNKDARPPVKYDDVSDISERNCNWEK